ncbi:agmatinase [Ectothiorhodospiraceae bacterium WFHF3C12]|nr:agmatinase [Ectothiorhodospiraceae bacterium WFHF3C12]
MTELRFQALPNATEKEADVLILPVPLESTVSYKLGTRSGPEAILAASEQLEYYEEDGGWCPFRHMDVGVLSAMNKRLHEGEGEFHERLRARVAELPAAGSLFLALGGEHSITPAMVRARMPGPGTVVLLDAHADFRRVYEGTEHSHACPMHHVRENGHEIIMIGIRSIFEEEAERIAADPGVHLYRDRSLQRRDVWEQLLAQLRALTGPAYLTIDMDGFDPSLVSGVGTPQPGGLSWFQVLEIVDACMGNEGVDWRGADIVEAIGEPTRVTDMTGAKLAHKIISGWGLRHGYDRRPANGPQTRVDYD